MAFEYFKTSHVFIENEIRKLREAGKLDNLPGAGKPIPGIEDAYDPDWWIKSLLKREKLSVLPETLQLRVEIQRLMESIATLPSEEAVREIVSQLNTRIRRMNTTAYAGPMTTLVEMDVDAALKRWHQVKTQK